MPFGELIQIGCLQGLEALKYSIAASLQGLEALKYTIAASSPSSRIKVITNRWILISVQFPRKWVLERTFQCMTDEGGDQRDVNHENRSYYQQRGGLYHGCWQWIIGSVGSRWIVSYARLRKIVSHESKLPLWALRSSISTTNSLNLSLQDVYSRIWPKLFFRELERKIMMWTS